MSCLLHKLGYIIRYKYCKQINKYLYCYGLHLFQTLLCKFKRHSKLHLNSNSIKNLLTFTSGYLVKFCNFYPQLSLETVFPALKLIQIFCINMNISFLENCHFNHILASPLLLTYQAWKSILTIPQNMNVRGIQIFLLSNYGDLGEIWKYSLS